MSGLYGIDLVISRIWEDLSLSSKEIVLEGYLEMYKDICIVCSGNVTDGKCEDGACPGPASKTREETCEEAYWAMRDNLGDMGFDTDATSLLSSFIEAWEHDTLRASYSGLTLYEAQKLKPYRDAVGIELTKIKDTHPEVVLRVDFHRLSKDLEYARIKLGTLLMGGSNV